MISKLRPPGYQAPVVRASWYRNERQERSGRSKAGKREVEKKIVSYCLIQILLILDIVINTWRVNASSSNDHAW